jgi:hypothetical protein
VLQLGRLHKELFRCGLTGQKLPNLVTLLSIMTVIIVALSITFTYGFKRRHDTHRYDIQHKDTQSCNTQHKGLFHSIQHAL